MSASTQGTDRMRGGVSTTVLNDVFLSPFKVDRLDARRRRVSGAVYDDTGALVRSSVRFESQHGIVENGSPESIDFANISDVPNLAGTWLFGGHFMRQFGHFVTESLTTVWPQGEFAGIVALPFIFGGRMNDWHRELYAKLHPGLPVRVVGAGCRVERLVVPTRPVAINEYVMPEAVTVWGRLAEYSAEGRRVFVSRAKLPSDPRALPGDGALDELAASLGFEVVHPEMLPVAAQLSIVGSASVLAGLSGSALHLSAFAAPGTTVIEIGDLRSPRAPLPMQVLIDSAKSHRTAFVPLMRDGDGRNMTESASLLESLLPERA